MTINELANLEERVKALKDALLLCTEEQRLVFKRMYGAGNANSPIEKVIGGMDIKKLDWAIKRVASTIKKNREVPRTWRLE